MLELLYNGSYAQIRSLASVLWVRDTFVDKRGIGRISMKNSDYIIYMTSRRGRTWRWFRDETGWKQVGPDGQTHHPTAEQVLNHLLPACANIKPVTLRVEYRGPYKYPHKRK